ncbi:hypothetical protein [Clostridium sp.]|jgi:hypothetical protein|uniref:hypothetical protein n=1 Tax=Clostridium sp. TaxID=1506 RepID=UPI003EEAF67F
MNSEIIKKLVKIEKLKYEIIKDILPQKALHRLNNFEKEAMTIIKDIAVSVMSESCEKSEAEAKKEVKRLRLIFYN